MDHAVRSAASSSPFDPVVQPAPPEILGTCREDDAPAPATGAPTQAARPEPWEHYGDPPPFLLPRPRDGAHPAVPLQNRDEFKPRPEVAHHEERGFFEKVRDNLVDPPTAKQIENKLKEAGRDFAMTQDRTVKTPVEQYADDREKMNPDMRQFPIPTKTPKIPLP